MNKWVGLAGYFFAAAVLFSAISTDVSGQEGYVPDEIVVKLKRPQDLRLVAKRYGLDPAPIERFGNRPIYRLRISGGQTPQDLAESLINDPKRRVLFAEPNFIVGFPESNGNSWMIGGSSGGFVAQWFRDVIRLPQAHLVTQGSGIRIAVLDTGVAPNHPELAARLIPGYDFVDDDTEPWEVGGQPGNPGFGHGTHVAGLAALVAPQASIMPVRVLDPNGVGNIWVLAEAIAFAADPDRNPATPDGADIINLSLATQRQTDLLSEILRDATCSDDDLGGQGCTFGKDIVVVAGAGNRSSDIPEYPAGEQFGGLISVAATNSADVLAPFSNFGSWIRVAAPGQAILSTVPPNAYATWSGTSMATPLVAGQAALVRAQNPQMTSADVVARIVGTSDPIEAPVPLRIDVASSLLVP